jgi:hypothetical protein
MVLPVGFLYRAGFLQHSHCPSHGYGQGASLKQGYDETHKLLNGAYLYMPCNSLHKRAPTGISNHADYGCHANC